MVEQDHAAHAEHILGKKRPQDARRHRQEDGERHAPTFIESRKAEEHEDEAQGEHAQRRAARRLLLAALTRPLDVEARRRNLGDDFFRRPHRVARAVARGGVALDLHGACRVEARDDRRTRAALRLQERIERHHRARTRLDEDEARRLNLRAIRHIRLHHDLIGAAELVEVVDLIAAEVDLQRREHVTHLHAELLGPLTVNFEIIDWRIGTVRRPHALQLRTLVHRLHDLFRDRVQLLVRMPRHILQLHRPAADHAEAGQSRLVERDDLRLRRDFRADAERLADEHIDVRFYRRALVPRL